VYGNLSSPITLSANATYYILSQEVSGGDQWYDFNTTVTTTLDATLMGGVSGTDAPYATVPAPDNDQEYVPLDFTYTLATPTPTPTPTLTPTPTPTPTTNIPPNQTTPLTMHTNPLFLIVMVDGTIPFRWLSL